MNVLAVILARADSKGVSGKNFRQLLGKLVICYTIESARTAEEVDRVAVTTDELRFKPICTGYGVDMVERPPELAQDTSRISDAARHCCLEIQKRDATSPTWSSCYMLMYPFGPMELSTRRYNT